MCKNLVFIFCPSSSFIQNTFHFKYRNAYDCLPDQRKIEYRILKFHSSIQFFELFCSFLCRPLSHCCWAHFRLQCGWSGVSEAGNKRAARCAAVRRIGRVKDSPKCSSSSMRLFLIGFYCYILLALPSRFSFHSQLRLGSFWIFDLVRFQAFFVVRFACIPMVYVIPHSRHDRKKNNSKLPQRPTRIATAAARRWLRWTVAAWWWRPVIYAGRLISDHIDDVPIDNLSRASSAIFYLFVFSVASFRFFLVLFVSFHMLNQRQQNGSYVRHAIQSK